MKTVLVTGTYDFLHPGHLWFFQRARAFGDRLVVVVARDRTVHRVKGHLPFHTERERLAMVQNVESVDSAVLGKSGDKFAVVEKIRPDVICLGYDQRAFTENLVKELRKRGLSARIVRLAAYNPQQYKSSIFRTANLIDLHTFDTTLSIDLPYATRKNFTKKKLYRHTRTFLRYDVAKRLLRAQRLLKRQGYRIKIWDAYRPLSVQKILWKHKPDSRFVMPPRTGSPHNRGGAVDCTLVDKNGRELPMPSGYDEFSSHAHRNSQNMGAAQRQNMLILERAMRKVGFIPLPTEWWHFSAPNWKRLPILDIPL